MIRLFIALTIDHDIMQKFSAIITDFKSHGGKVKWVDAKNMHITLKFLGNTDPNMVESIKTELNKSVANFQAIESEFSSLGGFPNLRKPKVIWTDLEKNKDVVIKLAQAIEHACVAVGFEKNSKPFTPHLTLGRVKSYDDLSGLTEYLASYQFENLPINFNSVKLIQSTLTQEGPIYRTLDEIKLTERFCN